MRCFCFLLAVLFAVAAQVPAQTFLNRFVTPRGAEFFEGASSSGVMLAYVASRTQQIDLNLVGQSIRLIRGIGWRRDGTATAGPSKICDITVVMSHSDYATVTSTFASNYKDNPVTVFTKKSVTIPDWSVAPTLPPAPFDMVLPFDVPFIYNRVDALLWEAVVENNTAGSFSQDWVSSTIHEYGPYPFRRGSGCTTSGGPFLQSTCMRVSPSMLLELGFVAQGAPPQAPVLLVLGASDPGLVLPGLCATLHVQPLIFLAAGTADAAGRISPVFLASSPWNAALAGLPLHSQALAMDLTQPGLPFALSDAWRPVAPLSTGPALIGTKRTWSTTSATAPTGSNPTVSSLPTVYLY